MNEEVLNWIKELIKGNNLKKFYNSKTLWRPVRAAALKRDNYECQICKSKGLYNEATTVHHIKHLKEFPGLALDLNNLVSVCSNCHNILHPEKSKIKKKTEINEERW